MSVSLATRGMIQGCCQQETVISLDGPLMQQTLEVRPRIRTAAGPPAPVLTPPTPITALELRPSMRAADAPAPPDTDPKPTQISTQELKPKIIKAEEE